MDFIAFLQSLNSPEFWQQRKSLCFVSSSYPIAWFTMLFSQLNKKNTLPYPYQRILIHAAEKKTLYATFNQSILGQFSFFWLGDVSEEKESKSFQELTDFLFAYQGPHALAYFINSSSKLLTKRSTENIIPLPHEITLAEFTEYARFFGITLDAKKTAFLKKAFASNASISLDQSCMLINYLELIATKYLDDYSPFLASITGASPSLSLLSELFFAKNIQPFFATWEKVKNDYPEMFWIIFWSEQVWKAHHVITYLQAKDFVAAKKMSYRLPYTFINRDWQKTNALSLVHAYEFLYQIDYAFKTGSTFCSLDLFYMNYFTGKL